MTFGDWGADWAGCSGRFGFWQLLDLFEAWVWVTGGPGMRVKNTHP